MESIKFAFKNSGPEFLHAKTGEERITVLTVAQLVLRLWGKHFAQNNSKICINVKKMYKITLSARNSDKLWMA